MAGLRAESDFVALVAEEIASGIDCALRYWLGRIELEVIDRSLIPAERLYAIEQILAEYKAGDIHSKENSTSPAATTNEPSPEVRLRNK